MKRVAAGALATLGGNDLVAFEDAIDDLIKPVIDLGADG